MTRTIGALKGDKKRICTVYMATGCEGKDHARKQPLMEVVDRHGVAGHIITGRIKIHSQSLYNHAPSPIAHTTTEVVSVVSLDPAPPSRFSPCSARVGSTHMADPVGMPQALNPASSVSKFWVLTTAPSSLPKRSSSDWLAPGNGGIERV